MAVRQISFDETKERRLSGTPPETARTLIRSLLTAFQSNEVLAPGSYTAVDKVCIVIPLSSNFKKRIVSLLVWKDLEKTPIITTKLLAPFRDPTFVPIMLIKLLGSLPVQGPVATHDYLVTASLSGYRYLNQAG